MENSLPKKQIIQQLQEFLSNQDNNQKINVTISVALELYRVLVSSLLILFVPQDCDGHLCSLTENMETTSQLYTTGLFFNFSTMFVFLIMYRLEIKRENRLITYLDVNKSKAADNDSVGLVLHKLPIEKKNSILNLDKYYQKAAYVAMVSFVINSIISGIVVYQYSLGNQTTTTIITNILFMVSKLSDVFITVNTEKNIFYSAYLKGKIQYNDVDPDKLLIDVVEFGKLEKITDIEFNKDSHEENVVVINEEKEIELIVEKDEELAYKQEQIDEEQEQIDEEQEQIDEEEEEEQINEEEEQIDEEEEEQINEEQEQV
jgi:cytochrome b subunit of formate dehydrogenase